MSFIASAVGVVVILGLAYLGLKALVNAVSSVAVSAIVTLFTSPITLNKQDRP